MLLHRPQTAEVARLFSQRSPAWSLQPLRRPCRLLTGRKQLRRLYHLQKLAAPSRQQPVMFPGPLDVDQELWGVLDMASDEELEALHRILYGRSPLSPLIKSIVGESDPPAINLRGRQSVMQRIESRFRFLAADAAGTLMGYRPSYRETLLRVQHKLEVNCPSSLATEDLEVEIFMHLLDQHIDAVKDLTKGINTAATSGRLNARKARGGERGWWGENVVASMQLGLDELMPTVAKLGSAVGVIRLQQAALRELGCQLLVQTARYQAALKVLASGVGGRAAVQAAQAGMTSTAVRYGTVRGALGLLGPAMWAWFATDLALKSVGTDHGRIARAVFAIAQIRLLRTHGFVNPATGFDTCS